MMVDEVLPVKLKVFPFTSPLCSVILTLQFLPFYLSPLLFLCENVADGLRNYHYKLHISFSWKENYMLGWLSKHVIGETSDEYSAEFWDVGFNGVAERSISPGSPWLSGHFFSIPCLIFTKYSKCMLLTLLSLLNFDMAKKTNSSLFCCLSLIILLEYPSAKPKIESVVSAIPFINNCH